MNNHLLTTYYRCNNEFDFSDHLVLAVVQYIIPSVLESHVSIALITSRVSHSTIFKLIYPDQGFVSSSLGSVPKKYGSVVFDLVLLCHIFSLTASLCIVLLNFRSIFFTCRYFHSPLESIVGFFVAYFFSYHPIRHAKVYNILLNQIRQS